MTLAKTQTFILIECSNCQNMVIKKAFIRGLHHVTALADSAGKNLDFYSGLLGLRLIKKTINFDDPAVYHLYYGDEKGSAGTIMTFFPYTGMRAGRHGTGQMTATSFSVSISAIDYWMRRFEHYQVNFIKPMRRFNEEFIYFEDAHGLGLELVFNDRDQRPAFTYGNIPAEYGIKGFYSVTLSETNADGTEKLLTEGLDHTFVERKNNRIRYTTGGKPGEYVDILVSPGALHGLSGSGTIHHLAFATPDDATQLLAREHLQSIGVDVTPVIDRQYFHSVYFREPGGILFEIATIPPGFMVDEDIANLGEGLKLPAWMEPSRDQIEGRLEPLRVQVENFMD